jgi:hypothetical protein
MERPQQDNQNLHHGRNLVDRPFSGRMGVTHD